MDESRPEEKSPLLLYLVEGEGNPCKNNKRVNFDKGRLYGISSGATAVFTEFPNYISPCWITTLLSGLIFFMMVLLMVSSMGSSNNLRVPRCTHNPPEDIDNKTIYLVHAANDWTNEQIDLLETIKKEFDGYNVHLVILRPTDKNNIVKQELKSTEMLTQNYSQLISSSISSITPMNPAIIEIKKARRSKKTFRTFKRKKREHLGDKVGIGFGMKNLLDILLRSKVESNVITKRNLNESKPLSNFVNLTDLFEFTTPLPPKTLDDVIKEFPKLTVRNVTAEEVFIKSPLRYSWVRLNSDLLIFAVRILHLWQYGGLSFRIDDENEMKTDWKEAEQFSVAPELTIATLESEAVVSNRENKLLNFIATGKRTFESLPKEVVTADDEGLHIYTKSPCHVFFGEVLIHLKQAKEDETPKGVIQKSLKVFCKHSAVGNNYCKTLFRQAT